MNPGVGMIEVHEVRLHLTDGQSVECYLEKIPPGYMGELFFPPMSNNLLKVLFRSPQQFATANECYEWLVSQALRYATEFNLAVDRIDNPCNDPFIKRPDQQIVLAKLNVAVPVLVNGQ